MSSRPTSSDDALTNSVSGLRSLFLRSRKVCRSWPMLWTNSMRMELPSWQILTVMSINAFTVRSFSEPPTNRNLFMPAYHG